MGIIAFNQIFFFLLFLGLLLSLLEQIFIEFLSTQYLIREFADINPFKNGGTLHLLIESLDYLLVSQLFGFRGNLNWFIAHTLDHASHPLLGAENEL